MIPSKTKKNTTNIHPARLNSAILFAICTRQVITIKRPSHSWLILIHANITQRKYPTFQVLFPNSYHGRQSPLCHCQYQPSKQRRLEQYRMISEAVAGLDAYEFSRLNRNGQGVDIDEIVSTQSHQWCYCYWRFTTCPVVDGEDICECQ